MEADAYAMKTSGRGQAHQNVIIPNYSYEAELNIWKQVDIPPASLYKPVGYNDLKRVRIIMEGNDEERRDPKFDLAEMNPLDRANR